jgi:hypothetical protein
LLVAIIEDPNSSFPDTFSNSFRLGPGFAGARLPQARGIRTAIPIAFR